jgi:hypothetical protein
VSSIVVTGLRRCCAGLSAGCGAAAFHTVAVGEGAGVERGLGAGSARGGRVGGGVVGRAMGGGAWTGASRGAGV